MNPSTAGGDVEDEGGDPLPPVVRLLFRFVREDVPGERWLAAYRRAWPAYRRWFLSQGDAARPSLSTCRARLVEHLPELLPTWERLGELTGGDPQTARMLSLWNPAPFLAGCSQAVLLGDRPALVRNYDYHPDAFEGHVLLSRWSGRAVLAPVDCLWGALDGVNDRGLAVALAFGGRRTVGDGFGIPLLVRHLLETCGTVHEAVRVLRRVPSHMTYTVTLLDADGRHAVAFVAPDRPVRVSRRTVAANHQERVEWPEYSALTASPLRERFLRRLVAESKVTAEAAARRFLEPPLRQTGYASGVGTLYTVVYRPGERSAEFLWPGGSVRVSCDSFDERDVAVALSP